MAKRSGMKGGPKESREERSSEPKAKRGGAEGFDGGGFETGTHGRGPTPYSKAHSPKPNGHSIASHMATSGRGGDGQMGKGDGFKSRSQDVVQPQSHGAFESLGATDD